MTCLDDSLGRHRAWGTAAIGSESPEGNEGGGVNENGWAGVNRSGEDDRRSTPRGRRLGDTLLALSVIADIGCQRAGRALSEMTGTTIDAKAAQLRRVPLDSVPNLVGGPEVVVTATYVRISGEIQGHMLLMLPMKDGCSLASMLLSEAVEPRPDLPEMARSALGEVGNISASFFLAALADSAGMALSLSPPAVVVDMSGAVLDVVLADLGEESEEVLVIDTVFAQSQQLVNAVFLVLLRQSYFDVVLDKLPK